MSQDEIKKDIEESCRVLENTKEISTDIELSINKIILALKNNHKIILFGNGGSAADAQHIAAELIGRFRKERKSYPAIALTSDSSIITSLSNDYSFDIVFSRQCESLVEKGDVVIGISTSGNSKNIIKGLETASGKGAITIGLLGNGGGNISKIVDIALIINSKNTAKIQEAHRMVYHIICDKVEKELEIS